MTKILTVENECYDLDFVPEEVDDIRYCVLDYSDSKNADYIFVPLVFFQLELSRSTSTQFLNENLLNREF